MKDINILTIHFGMNHGSALQAYALTHYLCDNGYSAKVIDYVPERYGVWNNLVAHKAKKYPKFLIALYYPLAKIKSIRGRGIFERFLKRNVPLTCRYFGRDKLLDNPPKADVYIAGSDQIWNSDYNGIADTTYYLDFVNNPKNKIAYAASFGKEYPLDNSEVSIISPMLRQFNWISVRESSAIEILNQCNVSGDHVCDPTMLLNSKEWVTSLKIKEYNPQYILVYVMDELYQELLSFASELSLELNLKIYTVSFKPLNDERIDREFYRADPSEFVSLINSANFVVTNSFHGTVFSIIFKKRFLSVGKNNYNTRIVSLLDKLGLKERFISKNDVLTEEKRKRLYETTDLASMKIHLNEWVNESKQLLLTHLKDSMNYD